MVRCRDAIYGQLRAEHSASTITTAGEASSTPAVHPDLLTTRLQRKHLSDALDYSLQLSQTWQRNCKRRALCV